MHAYKIKPKNNLATIAKMANHGDHKDRIASFDRLVAYIREHESTTDEDLRRNDFSDAYIKRVAPLAIKAAREQSERGAGA